MANLASALKGEISRLARKEIKTQMGTTQRTTIHQRRDIAELKRLIQDLGKRIAFLESQERRRVSTQAPAELAEGARFSPKWVRAHRKRLGLSAAGFGKLIGVSALTIYNWEGGKSKPRAKQLAAWVKMRDLGKREASRRLAMLKR